MLPSNRRLALIAAIAGLIALSACHRRMALPKPYLALVANEGGRSVAVVNLARFKLVRVIPLSFAPAKIIARPGHPEVYVTSPTGEGAVIRFPELAVTGGFQTGPGPNELVFAPDGSIAYASGDHGRTIFKIDCASLAMKPLFHATGTISTIALDKAGKVLLALVAGKLLLLDPQNGVVKESANIGKGAGPLAVLPDGRKAFVADANEVAAVDLAGGQILSRIDVGSTPSLLAAKPDNGELFAFSAQDSTITILNASYDSVEESHPSGGDPVAAIFSPDSRWLYIANSGDGTVTRVNVGTREEFPVSVGIKPTALALTPDGRFLAVVDSAGGRLSVVRAATGELITSVPVGAEPADVAIPGWLGAQYP